MPTWPHSSAPRPDGIGADNLGSGTGYSVREVIDAARAVTGHNIPVIERERRPGDPPVLIAGNHRIAKELFWRPTRGLIEMITDAWAILAFHRLQ
jgi:UDP-glucose 4-epimerase